MTAPLQGVLEGGLWVFFVIFDTLVWLVFFEDNPVGGGTVSNVTIRMVILLLKRSLEFGTLICLYDTAISSLMRRI
jgi:hypothetical protein